MHVITRVSVKGILPTSGIHAQSISQGNTSHLWYTCTEYQSREYFPPLVYMHRVSVKGYFPPLVYMHRVSVKGILPTSGIHAQSISQGNTSHLWYTCTEYQSRDTSHLWYTCTEYQSRDTSHLWYTCIEYQSREYFPYTQMGGALTWAGHTWAEGVALTWAWHSHGRGTHMGETG